MSAVRASLPNSRRSIHAPQTTIDVLFRASKCRANALLSFERHTSALKLMQRSGKQGAA